MVKNPENSKYRKRNRKRRKKARKALWIFIALLLCFTGITYYQNVSIGLTTYTVTSEKIGAAFDGVSIIQLTDVHSIRSQKQADTIIEKVASCEPYLIALTGDLVDSRYYSTDQSAISCSETVEFVKRLIEIAPVYYIYGNHEIVLLDDPDGNPFKTALEEAGVHIINNQALVLEKDGEKMNLLGIQDPSTLYKDPYFAYVDGDKITAMLDYVTEGIDESLFTLLLSHRPEAFETYSKYPLDLVLTGHAHGGQFRIPFVGGVYAPNQGFFPKYTAGVFKDEASGMQMEVGRGIGNSTIPVRIFNQPEIVNVVLEAQ